MFIDFNKAFDSVKQRYLWRPTKNQGVEEWTIKTVKNLYKNSKAYVKLEKKGKEFQIRHGLKQGDLFHRIFSVTF